MTATSHSGRPSMNTSQVKQTVCNALQWEAECINRMLERVDEEFVNVIRLILQSEGRLITTGMGKMGFIARKAAATFSSTGTPSFFLHPGEAGHGDLGAVCPGDCLVALSYSGETDEVTSLLPYMKQVGVKVVAVTGKPTSTLGRSADHVINVNVDREADSISTAPTASTTLSMAVCDALAVTLMDLRGFTKNDFARYHPAGALGRSLLMRVGDLMHAESQLPLVPLGASLRDTIVEMSRKTFGCAIIVDGQKNLCGIFTDGDLRRAFQRTSDPLSLQVDELMCASPTTVAVSTLAAEALQVMEDKEITVLPVVSDANLPIGILHLHDLVRAGMA